MFFTQEILTKKGPLFRVWLAAHWKDKLTKAQVFELDIHDICENIMKLKVEMALRISGHLLVGVVRIHSRKAVFLLEDCISASRTVANKAKELDLQIPKKSKSTKTNVTLKQHFEIPEVDTSYIMAQLEHHNFSSDSINMQQECMRSSSFARISVSNVMSNMDDSLIMPDPQTSQSGGIPRLESGKIDHRSYLATPIKDDGFGAPLGSNILESLVRRQPSDLRGALSELPVPQEVPFLEPSPYIPAADGATEAPVPESVMGPSTVPHPETGKDKDDDLVIESLEIDSSVPVRRRRKARLIVDMEIQFSSEEIQDNILITDDIVVELDLAPPTAKMRRLKKTGTAQYMLHSMTRPGIAAALQKLYNRHLKMQPVDNFSEEEESRILSTTQNVTLQEQTLHNQATTPPLVEETSAVQVPEASSEPETGITVHEEVPTVQIEDGSLMQEMRSPLAEENPALLIQDDNLVQEESEENSPSYEKELRSFCSTVKNLLHARQKLLFTDTVDSTANRKQASKHFFMLLVLKKNNVIDLQQEKPYSNIHITKGPYYNRPDSEASA